MVLNRFEIEISLSCNMHCRLCLNFDEIEQKTMLLMKVSVVSLGKRYIRITRGRGLEINNYLYCESGLVASPGRDTLLV